MQRIIGFTLFAILAASGIGYRPATVSADQAADHAALLSGLTTVALSTGNLPGAVAVVGRKAFPLLIESATLRPTIAAGYYNDDESRARAVAFSHTNWVNVTDARAQLTLNALRWAGRKQAPVVGLGAGLTIKAWLQQQGLTVKDVTTAMDTPDNDLSGVDVFLFSFHSGYTDAAFQKMKNFTAGGGGLLALSTPWALSANTFRTANEILLPFGLGVNPVTISQLSYTAPAQPYSPYHSALNALDALLKQLNNQLTLTLDEQRTAAYAVENALGAQPDAPILTTPVKTLSDAYGLINVTTATPIARASRSCIASIEEKPAVHAPINARIAVRAEYALFSGRCTAAASSAASSPRCCATPTGPSSRPTPACRMTPSPWR